MKRRDSASLYGKAVYCTVEQSKNILRQILDCWCMGFSWINGFWYNQGGLLYLRKLDPQNISFRLCPTYMDGHTHTHTHMHTQTRTQSSLSLWLSCVMLWEAEVAFVGRAEYLCPLWQGLTVPAAACCLSPGHELPAGPPTNLPEPLPSSWRHPGWSRFMRLWHGPSRIPPHLPLLSGSLSSRKQPHCVPNVELHWEPVRVASYIFIVREDVDVLYFWGFLEKWKVKKECL